MFLTCKIGSDTKIISVEPYDILHILFKKLNITDEDSKFIFKKPMIFLQPVLSRR